MADPNSNNPYLNARREWNERYGNYIAAVKMWRSLALVSFLVAAVAVCSAMWLATQSEFIPFVVEVNKQGETVTIYEAQRGKPADERVIRAQIARFIKDVRSVYPDRTVREELATRAYTHLSRKLPAFSTLNQWYEKNNPNTRAREEGTTLVEVKQVLPVSKDTWRVEWVETLKDLSGIEREKTKMTGTIQVLLSGQVDNNTLQYNPIGLLVRHFDWSKELGS